MGSDQRGNSADESRQCKFIGPVRVKNVRFLALHGCAKVFTFPAKEIASAMCSTIRTNTYCQPLAFQYDFTVNGRIKRKYGDFVPNTQISLHETNNRRASKPFRDTLVLLDAEFAIERSC